MASDSPFKFRRWPVLDRGVIGHQAVSWLQVGPLMFEWHGPRWKFGVAIGPWYVGVLVGPLVATIGKRQFRATRSQEWEIGWKMISCLPPNLGEGE